MNLEEEQIVNQIIENVEVSIDNSIKANITPQNQQLLEYAKAFKKTIEDTAKDVDTLKEVAIKMQNLRHSTDPSQQLPKEYRKLETIKKKLLKSNLIQQRFQAVELFQNQLNALLGQEIKTVYVYNGKQGPQIYEIKGAELIKPSISSKNTMVGRYALSLKTLQTSEFARKIEEFPDREKDYIQSWSNAYQTAVRRFEETKKKSGNSVIYWQNSRGKYQAVQVSNKGDIAESYLNGMLGKKIKISKNNEINIGQLARLTAKVSNLSGLLAGDFESSVKGLQYQAKSYGASTLGISQMITLADEIIFSGGVYNLNQQITKQSSKFKKEVLRNKLIKDIGSSKEELLSYLQNLSKNK